MTAAPFRLRPHFAAVIAKISSNNHLSYYILIRYAQIQRGGSQVTEGWLCFCGEVALYWRTLCSMKTEYSIRMIDIKSFHIRGMVNMIYLRLTLFFIIRQWSY